MIRRVSIDELYVTWTLKDGLSFGDVYSISPDRQ